MRYNKSLVLIILILFSSFSLAATTFSSPTPEDSDDISQRNITLNSSIKGDLKNLRLSWNGTNYTVFSESTQLHLNFNNATGLGENYDSLSTGQDVADLSSIENNVTTEGNLSYREAGYNGSFNFDGEHDYIKVENASNLDGFPELTVSARVKLDQNQTSKRLIHKHNAYNLFISNDGEAGFGLYQDSYKLVTGNEKLEPGKWYHILGTYNGTHQTLYVNSDKVGETNNTGNIPNSDEHLYLGIDEDLSTGKFNGTMDEVRLWNQSMYMEQVEQAGNSNLRATNSTSWLFLSEQENLKDGNYTFQVFSKLPGENRSTEKREIKVWDYPSFGENYSKNIPVTGVNILGQKLNISYNSELMFNVDDTSYKTVEPGRMLEDFSQIDFHRGVKSDSTSIRSEIIDSGYIGRAGNFKYNYTSTGTDYFSITHELTRENHGIGLIDQGYDAVSFMARIDNTSRHKAKIRLHGVNGSGHSTACDTLYYELMHEGWHKYTIPITQVELGGCELDFNNVDSVSLLLNDVDNDDRGSGNLSIDEWRLRKQPSYLIDDWDYEKNGATVYRWVESSSNQGSDVNLSVTNQTSYSPNKSMKADYRYNGTGSDYINIRRSVAYTLDLNQFSRLVLSVKPDEPDFHRIKLRVWEDNTSKKCDTGYRKAEGGWQKMEWGMEDFSGDCNLSKIERFGFQLNDINNSEHGNGTVYIDDYRYIRDRVETNATLSWKDESTHNRTVNWSIDVLSDEGDMESKKKSFKTKSYSFNDSAQVHEEEARLQDWVDNLDYLGRHSFNYRKPTQRDREILVNGLECIEQQKYDCASANLSAIDYKLVELTDSETDEKFVAAVNSTENRGWGHYIYNPGSSTDLVVATPHPQEDTNTAYVGARAFKKTSAEWMFVGGADRNANLNFIAEPIELFNTQHPQFHALKNILEPEHDLLEVHGFVQSKHPGYPDFVISNGKGGEVLDILTREKQKLEDQGFSVGIYNQTHYDELGNTYSQFGRHTSDIGGDFVSNEIVYDVRTNQTLQENYWTAVSNTWNPETQENTDDSSSGGSSDRISSLPQPEPNITVEPEEIVESFRTGETIARTLEIRNTGEADAEIRLETANLEGISNISRRSLTVQKNSTSDLEATFKSSDPGRKTGSLEIEGPKKNFSITVELNIQPGKNGPEPEIDLDIPRNPETGENISFKLENLEGKTQITTELYRGKKLVNRTTITENLTGSTTMERRLRADLEKGQYRLSIKARQKDRETTASATFEISGQNTQTYLWLAAVAATVAGLGAAPLYYRREKNRAVDISEKIIQDIQAEKDVPQKGKARKIIERTIKNYQHLRIHATAKELERLQKTLEKEGGNTGPEE